MLGLAIPVETRLEGGELLWRSKLKCEASDAKSTIWSDDLDPTQKWFTRRLRACLTGSMYLLWQSVCIVGSEWPMVHRQQSRLKMTVPTFHIVIERESILLSCIYVIMNLLGCFVMQVEEFDYERNLRFVQGTTSCTTEPVSLDISLLHFSPHKATTRSKC